MTALYPEQAVTAAARAIQTAVAGTTPVVVDVAVFAARRAVEAAAPHIREADHARMAALEGALREALDVVRSEWEPVPYADADRWQALLDGEGQ